MPKKKFNLIILIFLVVLAAVISVKLLSNEDDWICRNGQWIKHGNPSAPAPIAGCSSVKNEIEPDIVIFSPQRGQTVKSPLLIEGMAKGNWFFEAVFPIRLLDDKGNELAASQVRATSNWMTEKLVPFKGEISFDPGAVSNGILILKNDNPSGLPEKEKQIQTPVNFIPKETMRVQVYFNNNKMDPEISCNKVFAVEREIVKTFATGKAALEELFKGPTNSEKAAGFLTVINSGVKVQSLVIKDGIANVDFNEALEYQVGGSCRVAAIRAQITQTLKQFSTVNEVIISINGRTEDILQP